MSQEDTTKYKTNPNSKNNNNNNNNSNKYNNNHHYSSNNKLNAMKYENKRTAAGAGVGSAALYENFIFSDNNNKQHPNFAVENNQNRSAQFNNEQDFVSNTTNAITAVATNVTSRLVKDKLIPDYENLHFNRPNLQLDKKVLLQKYFRTALVGPRTNIYENLCRGCNYGVFTARGPLCSFCECIVNGVPSISASPAESSNNIYENICENCAQFYSGNEEDCQCRKKKELVVSFRETETEVLEKKPLTLKKVGSEDFLNETTKEHNVKIRKTKSFSKTNKPKILTNFWDTLRKHKTPSTPAKKLPLEIVHNVEGYEQVFHTKETFDLQRICELKRSATSCSDQHIYGRLKQKDLVRSQEDFLSTQSLTQTEQQVGKRPRISKPKFLRSLSANSQIIELEIKAPKTEATSLVTTPSNTLQSVYLNNSVCQWMTSLRHHEINSHCVNTCILKVTDEECGGDCQCYPKSIPPAKKLFVNLTTSCKTAPPTPPIGVTNTANICKNNVTNIQSSPSTTSSSFSLSRESRESLTDTDSFDSTEIVALRRHTSRNSSAESLEGQREEKQQQPQPQQQVFSRLPKDHYQQMVDEFKFHLLNKQMKQQQLQQQHHQQHNPTKNDKIMKNTMASAGVNSNNNTNNNVSPKPNHSSTNVDIPLRQAISNHNKAKRQGMYLRLEESHNLHINNNITNIDGLLDLPQPHKVLNSSNNADHDDDHNNNSNTENHPKSTNNNISQREQLNKCDDDALNSNNVNNNELELSTVKSFDSDSQSIGQESHEFISCDLVSRALKPPVNVSISHALPAKRSGIHERNILQAFEALLKQEEQEQQPIEDRSVEERTDNDKESQIKDNSIVPNVNKVAQTTTTKCQVLQPFVADIKDKHTIEPYSTHCRCWSMPHAVIDLWDLINSLQLSCSLNTAVIRYDNNDKQLFVFLRYISQNGEKYKHATHEQLVRKYQRFHKYCLLRYSQPATKRLPTLKHSNSASKANSVDLKLDLMKTNGNLYGRIIVRSSEIPNNNDSLDESGETKFVLSEIPQKSENPPPITQVLQKNNSRKSKKPPEVPKRDPSTKLSPSSEQLPPIPLQRSTSSQKMTVPPSNLIKETRSGKSLKDEESIYQPIWKCKTVGEVQERFKTDEDYYDLKDLQREHCKIGHKSSEEIDDNVPEILISEEDHSEWEPDEEFVFTTEVSRAQRTESLNSHDRNATIRSNRSNNSSLGSTSLSGSTITDFASSTATLASCVSSSLMHHLFRNIGIFYSLSEPRLRAIIYDYDRIHASKYFAKTPLSNTASAPATVVNADDINDSGLGKSPTPSAVSQDRHKHQQHQHRSPVPMQRPHNGGYPIRRSESAKLPVAKVLAAGVTAATAVATATLADSPAQFTAPNASVLAWKQQLLNVNYMEDEEDMIVSESEIVRAQKIKEEVDTQPVQPQFYQRFKSRSTDNILDLPIEDDKKTITERMRSRFQRGILNINNKSSPKSEKKLYKALRNSQTTSLYLEDGLKPKHAIFGAPLDKLELNQTTYPNVPRFVVDAIEFIERKDRIVQDGLYRACGNKFSIDELKQKLTKSYIYDPKLIAADDIHTITSLLKQFFRDLPQPLIPQETYNCLARDLLKINEGIDTFRIAVNEMPDPNKSTLAFLIKHLTNVAACSSSNRMNASNLAIVWGPSLFTLNEAKTYDIGRMNTLAKVLIENYDRIFHTNERLL